MIEQSRSVTLVLRNDQVVSVIAKMLEARRAFSLRDLEGNKKVRSLDKMSNHDEGINRGTMPLQLVISVGADTLVIV